MSYNCKISQSFWIPDYNMVNNIPSCIILEYGGHYVICMIVSTFQKGGVGGLFAEEKVFWNVKYNCWIINWKLHQKVYTAWLFQGGISSACI